MFFDHNGIILEINNPKIIRKLQNILKLNNSFKNYPLFKGEAKREIRSYFN